jgi:UDP-glucose 4-epimerase
MNILVTGSSGYIGAHVVEALSNAGHQISCVDTVEKRLIPTTKFYSADIRDTGRIIEILRLDQVEILINLAALKSVGDSFNEPEAYMETNAFALERIISRLKDTKVSKVIQASSAAVYGNQKSIDVSESLTPIPMSPYADSKFHSELMLTNLAKELGIQAISLRFFNVLGSSRSELKDDSQANLVPSILDQYRRKVPINIFGGNLPTADGTCIRDYIHVLDLAKLVLELCRDQTTFLTPLVLNVGTGKGYSVLEVLQEVSQQIGSEIPYVINPQRSGDIVAIVADMRRAKELFDFTPEHNLHDMISSTLQSDLQTG